MFLVSTINSRMRQENIVSYNIRFIRRLPLLTQQMEEKRAPSWRLNSIIISLNCKSVRLIEGDPMLHSIPKYLKTLKSIMLKILSTITKTHIICNPYFPIYRIYLSKQILNFLTLFECSTIHHIHLPAFVEDPNDTKLHMAEYLINR